MRGIAAAEATEDDRLVSFNDINFAVARNASARVRVNHFLFKSTGLGVARILKKAVRRIGGER